MENKTIIITGVSGQDGSILADKYLLRGFKVIGVDRWFTTGDSVNLHNALKNENFKMITGDINEETFVQKLIIDYKPYIIYNMGAISLVPESFKIPKLVMQTNTLSLITMLEAIRLYSPKTRIYQASSSEQFGENKNQKKGLDSQMLPMSPYAISKLASYHFIRLYRKAYNIFAVNGLLYNHESPRRSSTFVTRKITKYIAGLINGEDNVLELGNIDAYRDWGDADDYCDAMILMMEADKPDDYIVATGETHSVREFVEKAFEYANFGIIKWKGEGINEKGYIGNNLVVKINKDLYRPAEVERLKGNANKIKKNLGWKRKTSFDTLVMEMLFYDIRPDIKYKVEQ